MIKSHKLIWNKNWKYVNNSFIENTSLLVNIFTWKDKLPINLVYCSSYTKRSYGGGYTILRLSLKYVIWCSLGSISLSTTKCGWSVKINSMQDSEFGDIWVGSDISWWKPWVETKESNLVPSIVVESPYHHGFDEALKSPKMTVKAGWKSWKLSKSFSKFDKKLWN